MQHIILTAGLLVLSVCDLRTRCIPVGFTLALNAAIFLTSFVSGNLQLPAAFSGLLPAFFSILFSLPDQRNFGAGDIWVLAMIGFSEGLESTILILFLAACLSAAYGFIHVGRNFRRLRIPFVPFLSIAAGGVILCRELTNII